MIVTFLGSGTSHGVPALCCSCPVCTSKNPLNKRTRSSLWIQTGEKSILIDTSTDLRFQALREGITSVDFILQTHAHADHTHGLDDIRTYSREKDIPLIGFEETLSEMRSRFSYMFTKTQKGGEKPKVELMPVEPGKTINLEGFSVIPIPIIHGKLTIAGYRWGSWAYLTDCSQIPQESLPLLNGVKNLIIGALRYRSHPTHFSLGEALAASDLIGATNTYLTHISHDLDHETLVRELPAQIKPAYDGLRIESEE